MDNLPVTLHTESYFLSPSNHPLPLPERNLNWLLLYKGVSTLRAQTGMQWSLLPLTALRTNTTGISHTQAPPLSSTRAIYSPVLFRWCKSRIFFPTSSAALPSSRRKRLIKGWDKVTLPFTLQSKVSQVSLGFSPLWALPTWEKLSQDKPRTSTSSCYKAPQRRGCEETSSSAVLLRRAWPSGQSSPRSHSYSKNTACKRKICPLAVHHF